VLERAVSITVADQGRGSAAGSTSDGSSSGRPEFAACTPEETWRKQYSASFFRSPSWSMSIGGKKVTTASV
jgi:hypothetical protein